MLFPYHLVRVISHKTVYIREKLTKYAVYFFCPETQGKSLEEIDLIFLKSGSELMMSDAAKTLQHGGRDVSSTEIEKGMTASEKGVPGSADGSL